MRQCRSARFALACAVPFLSGFCDAATDDPHGGGFLRGVQGLSGGCYQHRIKRLEHEATSLERMNQDLQAGIIRHHDETRSVEKTILINKKHLEEDRAITNALDIEIERLKKQKNLTEQENKKLERQIAEMKQEENQIKDRISQAELAKRTLSEQVQIAEAEHRHRVKIARARSDIAKIRASR